MHGARRQHRKSGIIAASLTLLFLLAAGGTRLFATPLGSQADSILVFDVDVLVEADTISGAHHRTVQAVVLDSPGYYRVDARVWYNSGDLQKNESFYLLVRRPDGRYEYPQDPNAGPYRVVEDVPGPPRHIWRDAGLFFFSRGKNVIEMFHYVTIARRYPQFQNGPFGDAESVYLDSLKLVRQPFIDGALSLDGKGFAHGFTVDGLPIVTPGDSFSVVARVENVGLDPQPQSTLTVKLPSDLVIWQTSQRPDTVTNGVYRWTIPPMAVQEALDIRLHVLVAPRLAPGTQRLSVVGTLEVPADANPMNNVDTLRLVTLADSLGQRPRYADLEVRILRETQTLEPALTAGDTVDYVLQVYNAGPDTAFDVYLLNRPPVRVARNQIFPAPSLDRGDSLLWVFPTLPASEFVEVRYRLPVPACDPPIDTLLINTARIFAVNDTLLSNNTAADTARVAPASYDLAAILTASADTLLQTDVGAIPALYRGNAATFVGTVRHTGGTPACETRVTFSLAGPGTIVSALPSPDLTAEHEAVWLLQGLSTGEPFEAHIVVQSLDASADTVLLGQWQVHSTFDSNAANDVDSAVVLIVEPPGAVRRADVALTLTTLGDTTVTYEGRTYAAAARGDSVAFQITLQNHGPDIADSVVVVFDAPAYTGILQTIPPAEGPDALHRRWFLPQLAVGDTLSFLVKAHIDESLPDTVRFLVARATVSSPRDSLTDNNTAIDSLYVVPSPPPKDFLADLAITLESRSDTVVSRNGRTLAAVFPGDTVQVFLRSDNLGPASADTVIIRLDIPPFATVVHSVPAAYIADASSLQWRVFDMAAGSHVEQLVSLYIDADLPDTVSFIASRASVFSSQDTLPGNNVDIDTLAVLRRSPPPGIADLAVSLETITDTSVVRNGRIYPAAGAGDLMEFHITVSNRGPEEADSSRLRFQMPDFTVLVGAEPSPMDSAAGSLQWAIDRLAVGMNAEFQVRVRLLSRVPDTVAFVTGRVEAIYPADPQPANNTAADSIAVLAAASSYADVRLDLYLRSDSFAVEAGDTIWYAHPGEAVGVRFRVTNHGGAAATGVVLQALLPPSVLREATNPEPDAQSGDTLRWNVGMLDAAGVFQAQLQIRIPDDLAPGKYLYAISAQVAAANEPEDRLLDNSAADNVIVLVAHVLPPPLIEARPPRVAVGDTVQVRVQVPVEIAAWDLWVYYANGDIDSSYADAFLRTTSPVPGMWYEVDPPFTGTRLTTDAREEPIVFELHIQDRYGYRSSARATVTVHSANALALDRNVFNPARNGRLGIRFKLSSRRVARLDLFDVSGVHITPITEGVYEPDWNTYYWDGRTSDGREVGSGVYIILLRSAEFQSWRKVIIVR